MLNREKFKDEIMEIACSGSSLALDERTNKLVNCNDISCSNCGFNNSKDLAGCKSYCEEWCNSEYVEPKVDWSKVPIDTPILVKNVSEEWFRRYFVEYKDNIVYSYSCGATSWSSDGSKVPWEYAKLANEEDINKYAKTNDRE